MNQCYHYILSTTPLNFRVQLFCYNKQNNEDKRKRMNILRGGCVAVAVFGGVAVAVAGGASLARAGVRGASAAAGAGVAAAAEGVAELRGALLPRDDAALPPDLAVAVLLLFEDILCISFLNNSSKPQREMVQIDYIELKINCTLINSAS